MKSVINTTFNLICYILSKRNDIINLRFSDVLLGKVTLVDIRRKTVKKEFVNVLLYSVNLLHPIDRENAISAVINRAKTFEENKDKILNLRIINRELLEKLSPSVSCIKIIKENENSYISFDGNSRIQALKRVFGEKDNIMVEVELYIINNREKVLLKIDRLRRLYNRKHRSANN